MVHPFEMFWRQLRFAEFDVSEMSMSSLIIAASRGDTRWVAIRSSPMRKFFYTSIIVRDDSGITTPAGLRGRAARRAGISADLGDLVARHPAARVRRARPRHRVVMEPIGQEPRRRDRLRPRRRACASTRFRRPPIWARCCPPGELDGALALSGREEPGRSQQRVDVSGATHYRFPIRR